MNLSRTLPVALVGLLALAACGDDLEGTAKLDTAASVAPAGEAAGLTTTASSECVDALGKADDLIDLALEALDVGANAMSTAGDAFEAASRFDIDDMKAAGVEIRTISDWFVEHKPEAAAVRAAYDEAKAACLDA